MLRAPAKERCWLQRLLLRPNGIKLKNLIRLEGRTMPEVAVEDLHTLALFHHVHSFSDSMFTCLHTGCIVVFLGISFAWGGCQIQSALLGDPKVLGRPCHCHAVWYAQSDLSITKHPLGGPRIHGSSSWSPGAMTHSHMYLFIYIIYIYILYYILYILYIYVL